MYFGRDFKGEWLNQHYYKGFPRGFPLANIARSVPAVTGACLMIRRAVFEQVGGFTEDYVIGDYEDSDLCLKVRRGGLDILYQPQAELYHFERQSISRHGGYMRSVAGEYNRWLHGRRWADTMTALMTSTGDAQAARSRLDAPIDRNTRADR
jgi:GT2 family glycosyltransferase